MPNVPIIWKSWPIAPDGGRIGARELKRRRRRCHPSGHFVSGRIAWRVVTVRCAGEVITKEALFAAVWPDRVVSDGALSSCLRELRQALGDDQKAPRYIATVHRVGYRFIAKVERASPDPEPQSSWQAAEFFVGREAERAPARGVRQSLVRAAPARVRKRRGRYRQERTARSISRTASAAKDARGRPSKYRPVAWPWTVHPTQRAGRGLFAPARGPGTLVPSARRRAAGRAVAQVCAELAGARRERR